MLANVLLVIKGKNQYISWSLLKDLKGDELMPYINTFIKVISDTLKLLYNTKYWILRRRMGGVWEENCLIYNF